jgi:hypothetical protein
MAEKYYGLSPYVYCTDNPIRYIDPTGMEFSESAWRWVIQLLEEVERRNSKLASGIEEKSAMIKSGVGNNGKALTDKQINTYESEIKNQRSQIEGYLSVVSEILILAGSDQYYDVKTDDSKNVNGAFPGTGEYVSQAVFNFTNGNFDLLLPSSANISDFAHELKHAYQFETGAFSSGKKRDGTPFYDKGDEWEAYARGAQFGALPIYSLPSRYNDLQDGPMDATKLAPITLSMPSELQKIANKTYSAFRINGITYKMRVK